MSITTNAAELREKIQSNRYRTFTLPVLDITIEYRKPDLLKLSFNKALPGAIADAVISSYKEAMSGVDPEEYKRRMAKNNTEPDEGLVKDMSTKGYVLLSELATSVLIMDVPESDFDAQPKPLIAWKDIPEEDSIAFILHLIEAAQVSTTRQGGEISAKEIEEFPNKRQSPKRNTARTRG